MLNTIFYLFYSMNLNVYLHHNAPCVQLLKDVLNQRETNVTMTALYTCINMIGCYRHTAVNEPISVKPERNVSNQPMQLQSELQYGSWKTQKWEEFWTKAVKEEQRKKWRLCDDEHVTNLKLRRTPLKPRCSLGVWSRNSLVFVWKERRKSAAADSNSAIRAQTDSAEQFLFTVILHRLLFWKEMRSVFRSGRFQVKVIHLILIWHLFIYVNS